MPFATAVADGVLTLTLDTPGSPVNVFNRATALQLIDILRDVTPATTRAIVFDSAKPSSFINGVGLLLAHATQTYDDTVRASTPAWEAYRAVHDAPVPTIALVHGSCFGCGVEFALQCDYRIASDSCETQFYMTELNDYLFIPLFGGTWNLPATVGLAAAVELLLWGARWDGARAGAAGLVDAVVSHAERDASTRRLVENMITRQQVGRRRGPLPWSAREDEVVADTRRRIAALPPRYQRVYGDALELLICGARQSHSYLDHQGHELRHAAASALDPIGKAAYGFFYLRQMASQRACGRPSGNEPAAPLIAAIDGDGDAAAFAADLCGRKLAGDSLARETRVVFRLVDAAAARAGAGNGTARPGTHDVAVAATLAATPAATPTVYAPTYRAGGRLVELAIPSPSAALEPADAARLARTVQRLGFEVARTAPADVFVSTRLLLAFLAPLLRFVERGGDIATLNGALRAAGFVRRPHALLDGLDRAVLAEMLAAVTDRRPAAVAALLGRLDDDRYLDQVADTLVMDAVCLALLDAVLAIRARREVRDLSIVDLIARELLDFPRHLCSLCTWLKRARVQDALARGNALAPLVTESAVAAAQAFVADGRELYR